MQFGVRIFVSRSFTVTRAGGSRDERCMGHATADSYQRVVDRAPHLHLFRGIHLSNVLRLVPGCFVKVRLQLSLPEDASIVSVYNAVECNYK
jgi:hypothetical protein